MLKHSESNTVFCAKHFKMLYEGLDPELREEFLKVHLSKLNSITN